MNLDLKDAEDCPYRHFEDSDQRSGYLYTYPETNVEDCEEDHDLIPTGCPLIDHYITIKINPEAVRSAEIRCIKSELDRESKNIVFKNKQIVRLKEDITEKEHSLTEKHKYVESLERSLKELQDEDE